MKLKNSLVFCLFDCPQNQGVREQLVNSKKLVVCDLSHDCSSHQKHSMKFSIKSNACWPRSFGGSVSDTMHFAGSDRFLPKKMFFLMYFIGVFGENHFICFTHVLF